MATVLKDWWFKNKCSCLSGNSMETQGGYSVQETTIVEQRTHSAAATVNLLNSWGWEILPHPPHSPDLTPSDFHLFPKIKNTSEVSASTPMKMF
jgi:hypothetical protein